MKDAFLHSPRRGFVKWFGGMVAACAASVIAIPGVAYLFDPLLRRKRQTSAWYPVADAASITSETPTAVAVLGEQVDAWTRSPKQRLGTVWLSKRRDGRFFALSAECPHLGCQIQYQANYKQFACPCHESAFRKDGVALSGPSPRALDELETQVRNGKIEVRFTRFRLQVPEKIELGS